MLERFGVEMLGAQPRRRSRRPRTARSSRRRWRRSASTCPRSGVGALGRGGVGDRQATPASRRSCARRFTLGGSGGGIAYDESEFDDEGRLGARAVADARGAHRGERARLEGVRARGHARPGRQLHRRLLDREHRSDGRPHRRLDHGRAGDDAHRPRVPAPARRGARGHDRDRRRDRRRERPVRGRPEGRARPRHRDEPARVALERARVEGDRLPHREDRGEARRRLHARRAQERHHRARAPRSSRSSTTSSSSGRASRSRSSPAPTRRSARR